MSRIKLYILMILLLIFSSCSKEVSQIEYGTDQCEHCKMILTDQKYGALIFTDKGKSIKYDAMECMLDYIKENKINENEIDKYYVVQITDPGSLKDAETSVYLISPELRSPMGENISAFQNKEDAGKYQEEYGGEILSWDELKRKF